MNQVLLEVRDLTLQYRDASKPVIENLNFSIETGEILSLCGNSGAGKSTVVWALMGMLDCYGIQGSGTISYQEKSFDLREHPRGLTTDWREIALVPQCSMCALNPVKTIQETFWEMMKCHESGISRKACLAQSEQILDTVCLGHQVLQAYPHELSGGMKQRVSIALAIMYHPRLLILDEATTGLDMLVEADILGTIQKLKEEFNMSILMITHDHRLSDAFCHRKIQIGAMQ